MLANYLTNISNSFFFNDPATTEIYTLSLHDALPIWSTERRSRWRTYCTASASPATRPDRKSTRLNSSHVSNSYAVFCLKKKSSCENSRHTSKRQQIGRREEGKLW